MLQRIKTYNVILYASFKQHFSAYAMSELFMGLQNTTAIKPS